VPVYIRHGDEPLSEIHPGLAEAFKEGQSKVGPEKHFREFTPLAQKEFGIFRNSF